MWHEIIQPEKWHGIELIVGLILTVVGIFVVGMVLDLVRQSANSFLQSIVSRIQLKRDQVRITESI